MSNYRLYNHLFLPLFYTNPHSSPKHQSSSYRYPPKLHFPPLGSTQYSGYFFTVFPKNRTNEFEVVICQCRNQASMKLQILVVGLLLAVSTCELVQAVSMFRHGARYHLNSAYDGGQTRQDWGELTSVGMAQQYRFGSLLRAQYTDTLKFLRPSYNHSEVEVYSTDYNRTLASAVSHLAGLFPQKSGQKMPAGLSEALQVPPYKYTDNIQDEFALPQGRDLLPVRLNGPIYPCNNLSKEISKNVADEHAAIDEMNSRYGPFLDGISTIFNMSKLDIINSSNLIDSLTVDRFLNRPLPEEVTEGAYQNLLHLCYYSHLLRYSRNVSRAVSTPKLSKILSAFDKRISDPNSLNKLTVLSGHDTDIFPMLVALNLSSHTCIEQLYRFGKTSALNCQPGPEYASSVIWELHNTAGSYSVRVRSNGKLMNLCERNQTDCPYDEWKDRVKRVLIDVTELCPPLK